MVQEQLSRYGIGIVELVGIATSFLLITGITYYYGYYAAALNAEWIINLLTSKDLLTANLRLGAIIILVFMYLESIFDRDSGVNLVKEFIVGLIVLSLILIFTILNNRVWVEVIGYIVALIAIYGLIKFSLFWKWLCVLSLFFVVPFINGITAFEYKVKSNLPEVTLKEEEKKWLLYDTFSDKFVLIDSLRKDKNIRVVTSDDIDNIKIN